MRARVVVPPADIEPMIGSIRSGRETRLANLARFAGGGALFVGAAALTAVLLWHTVHGHGQTQLIDLKIFRRAGHDVLSGVSPYPAVTVDAMRGQPVFVYPAPAAVLFTALAVFLPLWNLMSVFRH